VGGFRQSGLISIEWGSDVDLLHISLGKELHTSGDRGGQWMICLIKKF
jgi:hypothetical protein